MRGPGRFHLGLELVAGLVAALPVIVSAVHSVSVGWIPLGDDAVIAARAYDVPTTHTPLLGQYSASSAVVGHGPQSSLGPMLYWLLALPARLLGPSALIVTVGLVATASIVGCVVLARRRGGDAFMVATAIAIAIVSRSVDPETLSDVWNPAAALFPFLLLVFVSWSLATGEARLLPLAVVLASFVTQCHLTYVPPTLALLAVAAAGLWVTRPDGVRRALVLAAVAGLVCWSAPLLEQAIHRPGNLVRIARTATAGEPTLGAAAGWHSVVRTVGWDPWWLREPRSPFERFADVTAAPGRLALASAAVILAVLAAATVVGVRRRRPDLAAAGALGFLLCVAAGVVTASTPSKGFLSYTVGYTLWWASFAGVFATLVLGWSVAQMLGDRFRVALGVPRAAALVAGIAAVLLAAVLVAARTGPERLQSAYAPVGEVVDRLASDQRPTIVAVGTGNELFLQFDVQTAIVYGLRQRGVRVMAQGVAVGHWYRPGAVRPERRVTVTSASTAPGSVVEEMRIREVPYGEGGPRPFHRLIVTSAPLR